jgi:hypothetical protein
MPVDTALLAKEVGKIAKLTAMKSNLPIALRAAPAAAIAVGGLVSKIVGNGDRNLVEERMLGTGDDAMQLGPPEPKRGQSQEREGTDKMMSGGQKL